MVHEKAIHTPNATHLAAEGEERRIPNRPNPLVDTEMETEGVVGDRKCAAPDTARQCKNASPVYFRTGPANDRNIEPTAPSSCCHNELKLKSSTPGPDPVHLVSGL